MGDITCVVDGCTKLVYARKRGLCRSHDRIQRLYLDPPRPDRGTPPEERFWAKVDTAGDCWEWTAFRNPKGYGQFNFPRGVVMAHRYAWELLVGPIPPAMQIDHMCKNRGCVNPDHLQVVTLAENTLLGEGPTAQNARRTHCPKGHPYAGDNLRVYARPGGRPSRYCRACQSSEQGWTAWEARRAKRATEDDTVVRTDQDGG